MHDYSSDSKRSGDEDFIQAVKLSQRSYKWWSYVKQIALIFFLWAFLKNVSWPHFRNNPPKRGELKLTKCEDLDMPFQCGNIVTPLDYTNPADPRSASIAVAFFPAGAGKTRTEDVMGSILLNPGGPGSSGLDFLSRAREGSTLAAQLDKLLEGKYNLVSFDPRGVGKTWPTVPCFTDDLDELVFLATTAANGLPGQHGSRIMKHEVGYTISQERLVAELCQNHPDSDLLRFMGSAFVVRDMQLLHRALGDEKLNYWGFSYGTVLGNTYAAMFPDDINRLIIDGVVDIENYYQGRWSDNFKDIESELDGFFQECIDIGKDHCKLAELAQHSGELKEKVMEWGNQLKYYPAILPLETPPQIYRYSDFISEMFSSMYAPSRWPRLAEGLHAAMTEGNFSAVISPRPIPYGRSLLQIACGDNLRDPGEGVWEIHDYENFIADVRTDSPHFADFFGQIGLMCRGVWPARAAERYDGYFDTNTSFPILSLGNDLDPVTPGRYADKMANGFKNAVSVRRAGYGHCSSSQPSECIDNIVKDYFLKGELPDVGTFCKVDRSPFAKGPQVLGSSSGYSTLLDEAIFDSTQIFT